jgi:hypothetical protein
VRGPVNVAQTSTPSHAAGPRSTPSPRRHVEPPCDPGGGAPRPQKGCQDPDPDTGWIRLSPDGRLLLKPFHTYTNDASGRAYAAAHGLDFPFANEYLDAPAGPARPLDLASRTVCTASVGIDPTGAPGDHVVDCALVREAAARAAGVAVPVAVWSAHGEVVQVSELYRP